MGVTSEEAESYAKTVVAADFQEPGEEDIFRKLREDLRAEGLSIPDDIIRQKMAALLLTARDQIAPAS